MKNIVWAIKQVETFPKSWKVYPKNTYWEKNDPHFFFYTREKAQKYAYDLNSLEETFGNELDTLVET